jgi:replicative DNA helicase
VWVAAKVSPKGCIVNENRRQSPPRAYFKAANDVFARWRDDIRSGTGPVIYKHGFPYPEIGPGRVALIGAPPGRGKTAFVMQQSIEMLRFQPDLRVLVANCEMAPETLLDRQLARLSGLDAELVRRRQLRPEHEERIAAGVATLESVADRLAFMEAPYDIRNIAATVDAFRADVVVVDYIQRFTVPTEDVEARHRVNRTMDYLRQFANAGLAVIVISAVGRTRDKAGRSSYTGDGLSLASFRETSELEYGADDALILAPVDEDEPDVVRLSHLKARHGRQVDQEFHFDRAVQSFTLLSDPGAANDAGASSGLSAGTGQSTSRPSVAEDLRRLWENRAEADQNDTRLDGSGETSDEK